MALMGFLKNLLGKKTSENVIQNNSTQTDTHSTGNQSINTKSIEINPDEYDCTDILNTFQYAIQKFGTEICINSNKLKNILMDLSPGLSKEIKLLVCLGHNNFLKQIFESQNIDISDCILLIEVATDYLVEEELIDQSVAYGLCWKLVVGFSNYDIPNKQEEEERKRQLSLEEEKARKEAAKRRASKAAETRRRNAHEKELEELKKRLDDAEKARIVAEEKARVESEARRKEKQEAEAKISAEKKKRVTKKELELLMAQLQEDKYKKEIIDFSEQDTIMNLFGKYNGNIEGNVILVENGWNGDYCFVVDEIVRKNGIKARGTLYKDGVFYRNNSFPADRGYYHFYEGPSRTAINQIHEKRLPDYEAKVIEVATPKKTRARVNEVLVMPAGSDEYTSIEKIKAANPGKRIIVVKEGWTNDYCFCVEGFEGTIKAVGTRFLDGEPRSEDWVDRRHRKFKVYNGPSKKKIEAYYN